MERHAEAQDIFKNADCLHDAAAIAAAYDRMAEAIRVQYEEKKPLILCVMIGGLHPTSEITQRLKFPFQIDYLHATRYRGETTGGGLLWKAHPEISVRGRDVLVIDDILDEGHTLAAIIESLQKMEAASVKVAVLAEKIHDRKAPGIKADFVGVTVEDRYVFGCGMDYKSYWRQLPAIYAVKGL
ncbi:hypoxanthine-guanine phosphoribosyltransferase [Stenotrophobium rhamnosiphilum]|uniref:Hypoxanthine-guanine phosphoribosyltransferase n=1 Tax=Stenotrophobium rhamnosiphilum TaxID=2029166 RepID=A0A2T5MKR5_9GAMM|nr:hypoxanthine-guanine phosphoribosyltransferase [Stenotrophobium rhamnosiphilum]PTU33148.1 hypoxanthine-guanine phosphoribosyltransferase [Stenotrophobium rhamnosiphilum]